MFLFLVSFCVPVLHLFLFKDVRDRKILRTEFFQSSVCFYSSYTWSKIDEKIAVTDENIFRVCKVFDRKNNSHADMRSSFAQLLRKGFQHGEKDSTNKFFVIKRVRHR